MSDAATEFVGFLVSSGALRFGDFTLKSGARSPFFANFGDIDAGRDLEKLGQHMARGLRKHYPQADLLFGPAYKGIALAAVTAVGCWRLFERDLPFFYDRKEAKRHGEGGAFSGRAPRPGDRVVIVDDVLSSGGTKLQAAQALERSFGVKPIGILVGLDRRPRGVPWGPELPPLASLARLEDLQRYLAPRDTPQADLVRRFYEEGS